MSLALLSLFVLWKVSPGVSLMSPWCSSAEYRCPRCSRGWRQNVPLQSPSWAGPNIEIREDVDVFLDNQQHQIDVIACIINVSVWWKNSTLIFEKFLSFLCMIDSGVYVSYAVLLTVYASYIWWVQLSLISYDTELLRPQDSNRLDRCQTPWKGGLLTWSAHCEA